MNYLSHLFFAQNTAYSLTGNLMGDFKPSKELQAQLPEEIVLGIANHRLIDSLTDAHPGVRQLKPVFSKERRRYAGIITDIAFDYFLIKHWNQFTEKEFNAFVENCYVKLPQCLHFMPQRMQLTIKNMIKNDWLRAYADLSAIGISINQVSKRFRFENQLSGGLEEVEQHYSEIETTFLSLFHYLQRECANAKIELMQ